MSNPTSNDPAQIVLAAIPEIHRLALAWQQNHRDADKDDTRVNRPYVDLMFAFAYAKLGYQNQAQGLLNPLMLTLFSSDEEKPDHAHSWLYRAFACRIANASQGISDLEPFPDTLERELNGMDSTRLNGASWEYIVERFRSVSRILENLQPVDPFKKWKSFGGPHLRIARNLEQLSDRAKIQAEVAKLLHDVKAPSEARLIYPYLFPFLSKCDRALVDQFMQQVQDLLANSSNESLPADNNLAENSVILLFQSTFDYLVQYGDAKIVSSIWRSFYALLSQVEMNSRMMMLNQLGSICLKALRFFGLTSEIRELVAEIQHLRNFLIPQPIQLPMADAQLGMVPLGSLLAEGLFILQESEVGWSIVEELRRVLFTDAQQGANVPSFVSTVARYVFALGRAPVERAIPALQQVFRHLPKYRNRYTTETHFSRLHNEVIEAVVFAFIRLGGREFPTLAPSQQ